MRGRILITGGAGFVGSHLVERLVADGQPVHVVDDLSRGSADWLPDGVPLEVVDVRDARGLRRVVEQVRPETVVHLAAMHFIPDVDGAPAMARDVNVGGTRALLEVLKDSPPQRLLFASTAAVYPDRTGPIAETCSPAPLDVYGETKLEGERLVEGFASSSTTVVLARIFNVIGRRETNAHVVPDLVGQLRGGSRSVKLGNLDSRRDYTDVRDVADALGRLLAADVNSPATFNVGSGRSVSVAELVRVCGEILERTIDIEADEQRRRRQDRAELVSDAGLLRATTGWEPRWELRETLADLLNGAGYDLQV